MKWTATAVTTLGVIAFLTGSAFAQRPMPSREPAPPSRAMPRPPKAPTGAKALFYGSSGATLQSNAPLPGPRMSRDPDVPASGLATGFPTSPGTPAVAAQPGQQYMGVSYWVELLDSNGQLRRVTSDHSFRAGDRIRLNVQSNRDGYLTVLNIGSTGRVTTMFPLGPEPGAPIRAGQLLQVPPTAFLRFDNNPGEETLMLLLSPTPLGGPGDQGGPPVAGGSSGNNPSPPTGPDPGALPPPPPPVASGPPPAPPGSTPFPPPGGPMPPVGGGPSDGAGSPSASPGSSPPPPSSAPPPFPPPLPGGDVGSVPPPPGGAGPVAAGSPLSEGAKTALVRRAMLRGAKDLVVEVDGASPQPASYAVAPVSSLRDGGTIALQIKLKHY